jgi:hypothetical protein
MLFGSHLWAEDGAVSDVYLVRVGTVAGDPGIRASGRRLIADGVAWRPISDDGFERICGRRLV